jgi:PAS domain S-box-containing protein
MNGQIDYLKLLQEGDHNLSSFNEGIGDFLPAIIYVYDISERKIKFVNRKLPDLLGYSFEDVSGLPHSLFSLVLKEDEELVKRELQNFAALSGNESYSYHSRLNHKEGFWRYFKTTGKVLKRNEEGKAASVLCIAQDITDQVRSEEEITTTRELFEETEDLLEFGSWSWDPLTGEIKCTNGLYAIMEYDPKELAIQDRDFYMRHVSDEHRPVLEEIVSGALARGTEFEYEYLLRTSTGKQKMVSTKGRVITDKAGNPKRMLGITRDITNLKNLEKERERNIRDLNRSNRDLEEFAYVASHDLQEPLRKISTFGERLKTHCAGTLDKEATLYINRILASTENMRILIDNLLEFSKTTRSSLAYIKCNLNAVMQDVLSDQELKIEETKTRIQSGDLPVIDAVPSEMRQLFNNLIGNAVKFRKKNDDPVITVQSQRLSDAEKATHHLPAERIYYKIIFSDNGIGFEEEYAEKIFQIFQRLHGKAEYPGAGIGLAISKKIVDNHEGIIYGTSNNGKGSTFTVILPEAQDV